MNNMNYFFLNFMAHRAATQHSCAGRRNIKVILSSTKVQLILMWNTPVSNWQWFWESHAPAANAAEFSYPRQSGSPCWRCFSSTSVTGSHSGAGKMKQNKHTKPQKNSNDCRAAEPRSQHRAEAKRFHQSIDGKSALKLFLLEYLRFPDQKTIFSWKYLGFSVFLFKRGKLFYQNSMFCVGHSC